MKRALVSLLSIGMVSALIAVPVFGADEGVTAVNFGGSGDDSFNGISAVADGGYVATGYSSGFGSGDWSGSSGNGDSDAIIVKYDAKGNVGWKRNFGGSNEDCFNGIVAAADGGYVAAGYSDSGSFGNGDWSGVNGNGRNDAIIVKYDTEGNIEWKRNFGGSNIDQFNSIAAASDGGYVAVGFSYSGSFGNGDWSGISGNGDKDAIIVKYDAEGNVEWRRNFGGSNGDYFNSIVALTDGGYAAAGYSYSSSFGNGDWSGVSGKGSMDAIIVKYDAEGNVEWKRNFGGSDSDQFYSIASAADGGCVAVGWSVDSGSSVSYAIITKCDAEGNIKWNRYFGGGNGDYFYSIASAANGGYVAAGWSDVSGQSGVSGNDWANAMIAEYDVEGNVESKRAFGGNGEDWFVGIASATDGGYVAAGFSSNESFGSGDWSGVSGKGESDAIIVKFGDEPAPEEPAATERSYAFTKTIAEFGDTITVTVKGFDSAGYFTTENVIDKTTKFSGMGELQFGIILKVPEGMTVTSVTIK